MVIPDIFQVEDDEDFAFTMSCAVKQVDKNLSLTITKSGREALSFLDRFVENNSRPGLILLDFNLPGLSGIDLLKVIRALHHFDPVPVIIFSTSDNPKKEILAMECGASCYQTKPMGYWKLIDCMKKITGLWLK